jgi:2'-5' RNA ligase
VAVACATLGERLPDSTVKRVRPELLHLTAAFLGEVPEAAVRAASEAVEESGHRTRQFVARLGDVGAFPNERRPRAVWVGLAAGAPEFELAARCVREALAARALSYDDVAPLAHITIARVRDRVSSIERSRVAEALAALHGAVPAIEFRVAELHLFQSRLSPKGPSYESLVRVTLSD